MMQMLYVTKLQPLGYKEHTDATLRIIHRYLSKCLQHIFINKSDQILVQIHASTLNLHCTIYDSTTLTMKKLRDDTTQLRIKIINVKHLLYTYVSVMQQPDGSSCGLFTIAYAIDIVVGFNLKQSIYIVQEMWLYFHKNVNNKNKYSFPKHTTTQLNVISSVQP